MLSVEDDVDPIPTPVIPEEHAVEDDMDIEDDFDIAVDPIPTPLQIVKPKGWNPTKTEFTPKFPVLRRSSRHVEIYPPPLATSMMLSLKMLSY